MSASEPPPPAFLFGTFGDPSSSGSDSDSEQQKGEADRHNNDHQAAAAAAAAGSKQEEDVDDDAIAALPKNLQLASLRKVLAQVLSVSPPGAMMQAGGPRRGLDNLGNTCYVGAVIQALMACPGFVAILKHASSTTSATAPPLMGLLLLLLNRPDETRHLEILDLCRQFAGEQGLGRMHDASEFLTWLVDSLHSEQQSKDQMAGVVVEDEWQDVVSNRNKVTKSGLVGEKTFVTTLFQGTQLSKLQTGSKVSVTQESFWSINLLIDNSSVKSVNDSLLSYLSPEYVPLGRTQGIKTVELDELPRILILNLNRYKFDQKKNKTVKVLKTLDVPLTLTLPMDFLCEKRRKILDLATKNAQVEPNLAYSYILVAMIKHIGEAANAGHYTTIARVENDDWFLYDDRNVTKINPGPIISSPDVYCLFYCRRWNLSYAEAV